MRILRFLPLVLLPLLALGCNGKGRSGSAYSKKVVVRRDPGLEAGLGNLQNSQSITHTVVKGDTLYGLGRRYGVPVVALITANPGLDPKDMRIGERITVPGGGTAGARMATGVRSAPIAVGPRPPKAATPDRGRLRYPVSSRYRLVRGGNPGATFAVPGGTSVVAGANGKVVLASPDLGGLGPTVMIDHGHGLVTMYGQLLDFAVRPGQKVRRGEPIGRSGAVGLLFRVYEGTIPRDPASYIK